VYNFKNSLMALIGVITLIVVTTVLMPHIGYGSSGTTTNAPSSQTQNVNVVNTPAVNAQQSGTWNVGINGTPRVGIDAANNTVKIDTANPLPVRDVDNPARHAFTSPLSVTLFATETTSTTQCTDIPDGKRLVIEYFAGLASLPTGQKPLFRLDSTLGNFNQVVFVRTTFQFTSSGTDSFVISEPTRLYVDAVPNTNADLCFTLFRVNGDAGTASGSITISGYLVDVP
jgi:hypothetical protein